MENKEETADSPKLRGVVVRQVGGKNAMITKWSDGQVMGNTMDADRSKEVDLTDQDINDLDIQESDWRSVG